MLLAWHQPLWSRLVSRLDRLPHALLLAGPRGVGKSRFARALAARLLCAAPTAEGFACGKCSACRWFEAGNHPDLRVLEPGGDEPEAGGEEEAAELAAPRKKSDQILIGQVRGLEDFVNLGAHQDGAKVVIVRPAEAMNPSAANSLLKMLEEPASRVTFLLISHHPRRLLPTIRSRCQSLAFGKPETGAAERWLEAEGVGAPGILARSGGVPLAAKAVSDSGVVDKWDAFIGDLEEMARNGSLGPAARWEGELKPGRAQMQSGKSMLVDKPVLVEWLQKWVYDLVSLKLAGVIRYHPELAGRLTPIAERASAGNLVDCYNDLLKVRAVAPHPLNQRLFLEDLFARYLRGVAPGR